MIIVTIESTATHTREGNKNGKDWKMITQQCAITGHYQDGFPARYPRETTIQLDSEKPMPWAPGKYVISPESYFFGDFGRFSLGQIKLQTLGAFLDEIKQMDKKAA
jgi:hypothetical protein